METRPVQRADISALMSVYAKEQPGYLDACLASLAAQTLAADEILVIEDGPLPSALRDVLLAWEQRLPLRRVALPSNVGLGSALALGLPLCRHELVCRMDSDDLCAPDRFEMQYAYMRAHPETVICGGNLLEIDPASETVLGRRAVPESDADIRKTLLFRNPFNHVTVCLRKSSALDAGNYRHRPAMEDYDLWLRMLRSGRGYNLQRDLVKARTGSSMIARRSGMQYVRAEFRLFLDKRQQGYIGLLPGSLVFLSRALPRMLPPAGLGLLYRLSRRGPRTDPQKIKSQNNS